jgi:hypothetical protein
MPPTGTLESPVSSDIQRFLGRLLGGMLSWPFAMAVGSVVYFDTRGRVLR